MKKESTIIKQLKRKGWSDWDIKSYLTGWRKPARPKTKRKTKRTLT